MQELTESEVLLIMDKYACDPQQIISVLLDIQDASGQNYVDPKWARLTSRILKVPLANVYEILTFYAMFSTTPRGIYVIEICSNTPCHFSKSDELVSWFSKALGIKVGQSTKDGLFSLFRSPCVGACDIGPVAKIADEVYGHLTEPKVYALIDDLRNRNPFSEGSL